MFTCVTSEWVTEAKAIILVGGKIEAVGSAVPRAVQAPGKFWILP